MPSIVLYLMKCSISLAIVWLFYQLLLRRLTFYAINRWYLLGYAALSFLLPLIHVVFPAEAESTEKLPIFRYIPVLTGLSPEKNATQAAVYTGWDALLFLLASGALLFSGRLLIRWWSLYRIRKEAVLVQNAAVTIYQVNKPIIPFSFGNAIYINPRLHSEKEWEEIILHEYVHVRQRHTVDIMLAEVLCIVSWFNPFSWLIRHSIRQNLEFIADGQVLATGLDRKSYQYHLLKVIGEPRYRLANNFNFSSLKKRIIMMNRSKSARLHLVKFLFIVPMLGVLLVAFRDKVNIRLPASPPHHIVSVPATIRRDTTPAGSDVISMRKGTPDSVQPMIIIDEVEASEEAMNKLKPESIGFVDILKNANTDFGPRAKNGIVLVFMKQYAPVRKNEVLLKNGKRVRLYVAEPPPPGSMPARQEKNATDTALAVLLRPTEVTDYIIDSVRVGNDTYSGHSTGLVFTDTTQHREEDTPSNKWLKQALIIVDGLATPYSDLKIDPDKIESVNILKGQAARAQYGEKGKNGVLIIKMKTTASKDQRLSIQSNDNDKTTMKADTIHFKPVIGNH